MRFVVPKFINRKAKLIWVFSFQDILFLVVPAAILFFLKPQIVPPLSPSIFYGISIVVMGIVLALILLKIEGQPITFILKNFIFYNISPKLYLWKRKTISSQITTRMPEKKLDEEAEKKAKPLPTVTKSKLKDLSSKMESGQ